MIRTGLPLPILTLPHSSWLSVLQSLGAHFTSHAHQASSYQNNCTHLSLSEKFFPDAVFGAQVSVPWQPNILPMPFSLSSFSLILLDSGAWITVESSPCGQLSLNFFIALLGVPIYFSVFYQIWLLPLSFFFFSEALHFLFSCWRVLVLALTGWPSGSDWISWQDCWWIKVDILCVFTHWSLALRMSSQRVFLCICV